MAAFLRKFVPALESGILQAADLNVGAILTETLVADAQASHLTRLR
jgi:hypothetical protein